MSGGFVGPKKYESLRSQMKKKTEMENVFVAFSHSIFGTME